MYMRDYMKLENKFKIFIVFLILLLSIGSVSANEDADSDSLGLSENEDIGLSDNIGIGDIDLDDSLSSVDDKVDLELSAEENAIGLESSGSDKLGDPSKTLDEIQSLVDSANDGDTILLSGNYASSGKAVNISKSLTIDGQGTTTLDGKGASACIFYTDLDSGKVIIKGITFTNAHDSALRAYSTDSISIENCAFNKNSVAIWIESANSASIKNCVFNNNQDTQGGTKGAAIHVESVNSKILNCKFVNNTVDIAVDLSMSYGEGGAIYAHCNNSEINNCSFTSNRAAQRGGAIYDDSNQSKILNCVFKSNTARYWMEDMYCYGAGGAIYCIAKKSTITKCTFTSNRGSNGGAVYYKGTDCTITSCSFNKNIASKGGAIYKYSKTSADKKRLKVNKCNFTANQASSGRDVLGGTCTNCIYNYIKLSSKNKTIKKSAKKLVLSVKLTKGKTLLKSKKIKFRFRGKNYIAKTNKKGIAKVTIKRSVLKKLKAGKKYTVKISYSKYSIKRTVKVKR